MAFIRSKTKKSGLRYFQLVENAWNPFLQRPQQKVLYHFPKQETDQLVLPRWVLEKFKITPENLDRLSKKHQLIISQGEF